MYARSPYAALILGILLSAPAGAAPKTEELIEFTRLQGVRAEAGVLFASFQTTERQVRTGERTVTRLVQGQPVQRTVTVEFPVVVPVVRTLSTQSHDAFDGDGQTIPADEVFDRIKEGQLVFISKTSTLPREWLRLLTPQAVILAPKPDDKDNATEGTGSGAGR
jgi:hypothetical protein